MLLNLFGEGFVICLYCFLHLIENNTLREKSEAMSAGQRSLFYSVLNKREKLVQDDRIQHHVKVYERTLEMGVIRRGLRLKKKACLEVLSVEFKERWDKILVEAELNLLRLLYARQSRGKSRWTFNMIGYGNRLKRRLVVKRYGI